MYDFFGGPIRTESRAKDFENAQKLFRDLITVGAVTNTRMNIEKCGKPTRSMDIIGMNFNSEKKACFLAESKVAKYTSRLFKLRKLGTASSKDWENYQVIKTNGSQTLRCTVTGGFVELRFSKSRTPNF